MGSNPSVQRALAAADWILRIPDSARLRIYEDAYERTFRAGEAVVRKGDLADTWMGVTEGLLKVSTLHRTGKIILFTPLFEGSWAGEGSVFNRELYRYDIEAMRPSRLVCIPGSTFRWLLDTSIEFNQVILARLNARLGQFMALREVEGLTDPVAKVAQAIGVMYNPVLHPMIRALLPLSQSELGHFVGLSRQSVSSALKQLEREGLLGVAYGGVLIKKLNQLTNYSERGSIP